MAIDTKKTKEKIPVYDDPKEPDATENSWHDGDFYNGQATYDYLGSVPVVDGEHLNWMFLKGNGKPEFKQGKYSPSDMTKMYSLIYMKWQQAMEVVMENWEYEGLPDELDKTIIETLLLENGQAVFFKRYGKYYVSNFTSEKQNIYRNPSEVRLNNNEVEAFNDIKIKNFVWMRDTKSGLPLYSKILRILTNMIDVYVAIQVNLTASMPHGAFLDLWGADGGKRNPIGQFLTQITNSFQTFAPITIPKATWDNVDEALNDLVPRGSDIFIKLDLPNMINEHIISYNFWFNELKIELGLSVDNELKPENKVVAEVQSQMGFPKNVFKHRIRMRKEALDKINKMFGLNITIKANEDKKEVKEDGNEDYFSDKK